MQSDMIFHQNLLHEPLDVLQEMVYTGSVWLEGALIQRDGQNRRARRHCGVVRSGLRRSYFLSMIAITARKNIYPCLLFSTLVYFLEAFCRVRRAIHRESPAT
jgi:hypothetical protein